MPFTPYHFGPTGFLGVVFRRWVSLPAFMLVNVFMDLEPLTVITFHIRHYPEHGFSHTLVGAIIVALLFSIFYLPIKKPVNSVMRIFKLGQENGITQIIAGALSGALLHVVLDSFLYTDIMPLYPYDTNPFYGHISPAALRLYCLVSFGFMAVVYTAGLFMKKAGVKETRRVD